MAAGVTGIPCALAVDRQGTVRFVGHPAEPTFEAAIRQVIPHACLDGGGLCVRGREMRCLHLVPAGALSCHLQVRWKIVYCTVIA